MLCKLLFFSFAAIGMVAGRTMGSSKQKRIEDLIRKECKRYGAEDKVPELISAADKFSDCFLENVQLQDFTSMQRSTSAEAPDAVLRFTRHLCEKKTEIETCLFNMVDAFLPCTEPESRDKIDVHKAALQELNNYTCNNNAQIVSDLFEDGVMKCVETKIVRLHFCLATMETEDPETMSTAQACQKFSELRNCIVNTLKECPKPTPANFVAKVLDTVVKGSRCDNSISNNNNYYSITNRASEDDEDEELMELFENNV